MRHARAARPVALILLAGLVGTAALLRSCEEASSRVVAAPAPRVVRPVESLPTPAPESHEREAGLRVGSTSSAAPLDTRRRVGDLRRYRLQADYRTTIRAALQTASGGVAATMRLAELQTHVESLLEVRLDEVTAQASVVSCRFSAFQLQRRASSPSGESPERTETDLGLQEPVQVRLGFDARNRVTGVALSDGVTAEGADLLQALLADAIFFLPADSTERWETEGADLTGPYRATHRRSEAGTVHKVTREKEYTGVRSSTLASRPVHEGEMTFWFDADSGWLRSCHGRVRIRVCAEDDGIPVDVVQVQEFEIAPVDSVDAGGRELAEGAAGAVAAAPATEPTIADGSAGPDAETALDSTRGGSGPPAAGSFDSAATSPAAEATFEQEEISARLTSEQIEQSRREQVVAAHPLDAVMDRLRTAAEGLRFENAAVENYSTLKAHFAVSEQAVQDAVARLPGDDPRVQGLILDALAACGSPFAQEAVRGVVSDAQAAEATRVRAVRALAGAFPPVPETLALLEVSLSDPRLSAAGVHALGIIGYRNDDAPRDRIAAALETRLGSGGLGTVQALDALGNNGHAGSLQAILGYVRHVEFPVRLAALRALRGLPAPEADAALSDAMRADPRAEIRRVAAEATASRVDDATRSALGDLVLFDADLRVQHAALAALIARMPIDPAARPVVQAVADNSPDPMLRLYARSALLPG